jgi:hypothetical protein
MISGLKAAGIKIGDELLQGFKWRTIRRTK